MYTKQAFLSSFILFSSLTLADETANETTTAPDRNLTGFEALSESQPLWEAGLGGFIGETPNYPSSSERNVIGIVAPYVVYRGDIFRVGDGRGARAVFAENNKWQLDVSFGGAFSADSDDNSVREGMPELDFLFEVGPQVIYRMKDYDFASGGNGRLNFHFQTRAVFSTDFGSINQRGYVVEPQIKYQQRGRIFPNTALSVTFNAIFATEKLQDYFYQVDSEFVTPNRGLFDASSGYLGSELSLSFSFPVSPKIRVLLGTEIQYQQGAANQDSPLFEDDITYSVALGFIWRLYESKTQANL